MTIAAPRVNVPALCRNNTAAIVGVVKVDQAFSYVPGRRGGASVTAKQRVSRWNATLVGQAGGVAKKGAAELPVATDRREC